MSIAASQLTVRTFYVLDFDRCIGDTAKLHKVLEESVWRLTDISPQQIMAARREAELSGGSFDTASYVMKILESTDSRVSWDEICRAMIESARQQDMLEPHAGDLLRILDEMGARYGILTYGGEAWQKTKIRAAGLGHVPFLVTDVRAKGTALTRWQKADGTFLIPPELTTTDRPVVAECLVLVDDKAASFRGIPLGVQGFHVVWSDRELLPSQAGSLPAGVVTAHGMVGLIELLFGDKGVQIVDKT